MSDQYIGIVSASVHLIIAFLLALVATYGSFRLFDLLTRDIDENKELNANNTAVAVMLAGMLFTSALVLKAVISPAISTFETYFYQGMDGMSWLKFVGFFLGYVTGTLAVTIIAIWLAICTFLKLTREIDEFAEIKKGNVAVAIVLATAIVIMGYFLGDGIKALLEALVPFPAMQKIEIMS